MKTIIRHAATAGFILFAPGGFVLGAALLYRRYAQRTVSPNAPKPILLDPESSEIDLPISKALPGITGPVEF